MKTHAPVIVFRTAGILFAAASGIYAVTAYRESQRGQPTGFSFAMAVTYVALCIVFILLGRNRSGRSK